MEIIPIQKKQYEPPTVKKVNLEIKNAVLALCHTSPDFTPSTTSPCQLTPGCYNAP
jgi:hypothetical protein